MIRTALRPGLTLALLAGALAACSGDGGRPATPATPSTQQEAVSRIGDVTVRASVVPTMALGEAVAREYGIHRDDRQLMLLVAVRQGPEAQERALPARITATVTDLRGRAHAVELRELRTGDLLDYVGTLEVDLPDTLRFDLTIVREDGATSTMQFSREFHPR